MIPLFYGVTEIGAMYMSCIRGRSGGGGYAHSLGWCIFCICVFYPLVGNTCCGAICLSILSKYNSLR